MTDSRRLPLVHAHPDDEATGATMARYAAQGADVCLAAKVAALRAHRSQVDLTSGLFGQIAAAPDFALEHHQLVRGERGRGPGEHHWEDDLFAGLTGA